MADDDNPFKLPEFPGFIEQLDADDPGEYLRKLEENLKGRVLGQDRAVRHVIRALALSEAKMLQPGEPAGIMLFAGPPGVGKTELAYQIALHWIGISGAFTDSDRFPVEPLTKIDCTQLSEQISITELIGSKKGYVGYEEEVPFHQHKLDEAHYQYLRKLHDPEFNAIVEEYIKHSENADATGKKRAQAWYQTKRRKVLEKIESHKPYKKVVLFDEIEQAHRNIHNLILSIANGKPLKLSDGTRTSFENALIIMTSNIGWQKIQQLLREARGESEMGFHDQAEVIDWQKKMDDQKSRELNDKVDHAVFGEIEKFFSAAFMSRIRRKIAVFRPLTPELLGRIVEQKLQDIQMLFMGIPLPGKKAADITLCVDFTEKFKKFIFEKSTDPQYGVRDLEQNIEKYAEEKIANLKNSKQVSDGDRILLDIDAAGEVIALRN